MDRSPPDLPLYGGKTPIEEITRLHAPEKVSETMFTRSSVAASFEAQNGGFPASIRENGTTSGLHGGRSTIWRWKRLHRRPHAPPRACEAPAEFSTSQHARARSGVCEAHATTLLAHAQATCRFAVPLNQPLSPRQHATSACHVSMPRGSQKKKEEKFGETEWGSSTVQVHPQGLYGLASKLNFLNLLFMHVLI